MIIWHHYPREEISSCCLNGRKNEMSWVSRVLVGGKDNAGLLIENRRVGDEPNDN